MTPSTRPFHRPGRSLASRRRIAAVIAVVSVAALAVLAVRALPGDGRRRAAPRLTTFAGTLRDLAGRGLPGGAVRSLFIGADDEPRVLASVVAGADGTYRMALDLPVGTPGVVVLMARAPGHETAGRQVALSQPRQDFVLAEGSASVVVRVRDAGDHPVAGAAISLAIEPTAGELGALTLFSATSNSLGEAELSELPLAAARIHWSARAAGHGNAFGEAPKGWGGEPTTIEVRLVPGALVEGEVVDRQGARVAGAQIALAEAVGPWGTHARADEAGRFTAADVPPGEAMLARVDADAYVLDGGLDEVGFTIPAGARHFQLTLHTEPAGAIAGLVVGSDGEPIADAEVQAQPADHRAGARRSVATDGDGRFRLRGLRLDTDWELEVRHPDHAPGFVDGIRPQRGGAPVTVTLAAGGGIAGRVVYDDGSPAAGVELYAHRTERSTAEVRGLKEFASTTTGPDGSYAIDHINPGELRVEVRPRAHMAWSEIAAHVLPAKVTEGSVTRLDPVTLTRGGSLEAEIASAPGDAGDRLVQLSFMRAGATGAPHELVVQRDDRGAVRVEDLEPGRYDVAAQLEHLGSAELTGVEIRAAGTARVRFAFPPRLALAGSVLRADGRPAAGARLELYDERSGSQARYPLAGRAPDNFTGNRAATDTAGRFMVAGLDAGRYHLRATLSGEAPLDRTLEVAAGAAPVTLRFAAAARCEVRVAGADHKPASNLVVVLEGTDGNRESTSVVTDAGGVARFEHLPAGSYRARAIMAGQPTAACSVTAGQSVAVEIAAPTTASAQR